MMDEIPANKVAFQDGFWGPRLEMNATKAIDHQWNQLEKTGCIQNFRLIADRIEGFREGFFFADSDAYKWLDAASRVYACYPYPSLKERMDSFINLICRTQTPDGYIYTYNQFFTPEVRWRNLQIEHELYCHGHLIEAGVSHYEATGERSLLEVAIKAANLLVRDFSNDGPTGTPGHQEIEIALIRLAKVTQDHRYVELAEHFIEQRGRIKPFLTHILAENRDHNDRTRKIEEAHKAYIASHPEHKVRFQLPSDNVTIKPRWGKQRWFASMASGKYFQQHAPIRKQTIPVGHAVRFAYQQTAVAMLYQERRDPTLLSSLEAAWDHLIMRRMYVTGGTGALPNIEGFGRDFELDPLYSYSETCAALGNILWNWEMTRITGNPKYADLTEWQLYNAASVGLGQDGTSYLYNNPLSSQGAITRQSWFKCPCCPSNISRIWADLGRYLYSFEENAVWVHQYVGNQTWHDPSSRGKRFGIKMESMMPWQGKVRIELAMDSATTFTLHLRVPSWSDAVFLKVNGKPLAFDPLKIPVHSITACGYDPRTSWYLPVQQSWSGGDVIELDFGMDFHIRATHPRVRATRGQAALTRGPLVYCLESTDNPGVDIFNVEIDPESLQAEHEDDLFNGITVLKGNAKDGSPLIFIPYFLWSNRGNSQMAVYVRTR
jgi:DUF1680 family protein